ncbi:hypothetical protein HPHPA11_0589 [Helicobacter pylori Hp A-11]|uniref:Uncharacterized protein n=1 Tax=Helicobacter pylori Hp A-11 TaxID=992035 RepID=N4TJQ4_HELPX|nr:hypothetical protein HPHPA11_0589 [Helicobacter pylori Hp A-11]
MNSFFELPFLNPFFFKILFFGGLIFLFANPHYFRFLIFSFLGGLMKNPF